MELVKIDIEGFEVPAFQSIANNDNMRRNIFIVEYSPKQVEEIVTHDIDYGDFLLNYFNVWNIGNWGWFNKAECVANRDALVNLDLGNGGYNTDLLLTPKDIDISNIQVL